jgi:hypothetical protein
MMRGIIAFLTGSCDEAKRLRQSFEFRIFPMLNPDGVINGNYRCNLAGNDLNRRYKKPSSYLHPTIHHFKAFMHSLLESKRSIFMYCDLHGHSMKRNVFFYGCDTKHRSGSNPAPTPNGISDGTHPKLFLLFPYLLHQRNSSFHFPDCRFKVQKSKEATSRVVAFREFGIPLSYTMEASFMGASASDVHFRSQDLEEIGHDWCRALLELGDSMRDEDKVESLAKEASALLATSAANDGIQDGYTSSEDEVILNPHLDTDQPPDPDDYAKAAHRSKRDPLSDPSSADAEGPTFSNFLRKSARSELVHHGRSKKRGGRKARSTSLTKLSVADIMNGALSRIHAAKNASSSGGADNPQVNSSGAASLPSGPATSPLPAAARSEAPAISRTPTIKNPTAATEHGRPPLAKRGLLVEKPGKGVSSNSAPAAPSPKVGVCAGAAPAAAGSGLAQGAALSEVGEVAESSSPIATRVVTIELQPAVGDGARGRMLHGKKVTDSVEKQRLAGGADPWAQTRGSEISLAAALVASAHWSDDRRYRHRLRIAEAQERVARRAGKKGGRDEPGMPGGDLLGGAIGSGHVAGGATNSGGDLSSMVDVVTNFGVVAGAGGREARGEGDRGGEKEPPLPFSRADSGTTSLIEAGSRGESTDVLGGHAAPEVVQGSVDLQGLSSPFPSGRSGVLVPSATRSEKGGGAREERAGGEEGAGQRGRDRDREEQEERAKRMVDLVAGGILSPEKAASAAAPTVDSLNSVAGAAPVHKPKMRKHK